MLLSFKYKCKFNELIRSMIIIFFKKDNTEEKQQNNIKLYARKTHSSHSLDA